MTDWDDLDIDWAMYHPKAREVLNLPFFWDPEDDDAPHGNETGADLFDYYREERGGSARFNTSRWVKSLIAAADPVDEEDDDEWEFTQNQMWIAAAFADIKVRGRTSPELAEYALASLDVLRWTAAREDFDRRRDTKFALMEGKLRGTPGLGY